MEQAAGSYVVSFEVERYYKGRRHHWMICRVQHPEKLVSWGHAPTLGLAESTAQQEVQDLSSGVTRGGQSSVTFKSFTHRIAGRNY